MDMFTQIVDVIVDGGDELEVCHGYPERCKLVGAFLMPSTALATHADNHQTVTLKKGAGGTGIGVTTTDVGATGEAALVKGTAVTISITGTGNDIEYEPTDCLEIAVTEGGTCAGLDARLILRWQPIR